MDHQPFETWILSPTELSAKDKHLLDNHLQTCTHCQKLANTWKSVEHELTHTPQAQPKPGFAQRFFASLAARRQLQHQEQVLRFLLYCSAGAFIALGLLIARVFSDKSLLDIAVSLFSSLIRVILQTLTFFSNLFASLQGPLPILLWIITTTTLLILTIGLGYSLWRVVFKGVNRK